MCAIIDAANVGSQLCGPKSNDAGRGFRDAVDKGRIRLVGGGTQLTKEFEDSGQQMMLWVGELRRRGKLTMHDGAQVDTLAEELRARARGEGDACESDDHHIIAVAQLSRARLLYTNDQALTRDFDNKQLIDAPRGKVYSTSVTSGLSSARRRLLARTDLCR